MCLPWHWGAQDSSCQQNTLAVKNLVGPLKYILIMNPSGNRLFVDSTRGGLATERGLVLGKQSLVWSGELVAH